MMTMVWSKVEKQVSGTVTMMRVTGVCVMES